MKRNIYIVLLFLFASYLSYGQGIECDTYTEPADTINMPYLGYNEMLDSVLAVTYPERNEILSNGRTSIDYNGGNVPFNIPIKVWLYHDDQGIGVQDALSVNEVYDLIDEVNQHYANSLTGIQFYLKCEIKHIFSTKFNTINDHKEYKALVKNNRDPGALNWHIIRNFHDSGGRARFPWKSNNKSFAQPFGGALDPGESITTAHEIGHTLGLLHTHENTRGVGNWNGDAGNCYQESVSRTRRQGGCLFSSGRKCDKNGDGLRDTAAAPNDSGGPDGPNTGNELMDLQNPPTDCSYAGGGTDNWGDAWDPPTRNFMSYLENRLCRIEFTEDQISVMHTYIVQLFRYTGIRWFNLDSFTLSSTVNNGESFQLYAPKSITAPTAGSTYHLESGSDVTLHAQESVELLSGFHAKNGSRLQITVAPIQDCDLVFLDFESNYNGRGEKSYHDEIQERLDKAAEIIERANERLLNGDQSLIEQVQSTHINIFPNPSNEQVTFRIDTFDGHLVESGSLTILNVSGNELIKTRFKSLSSESIQVDVSDLPEGIYFYEMLIEGKYYRGRLLKN